ncbi:MAG TPA: choice-of-anchor P family protein [Candidatus Bathyarchaeia archaeon]|nr:choice-of-anchor P family protein [Candidatus Bathyarchaeia archaeon]
MKTKKPLGALATITLVLFGMSMTIAPVHAWNTSGTATQYSGRAIGVLVTAPVVGTVTIADTGPLPPGGGFISATPVNIQTSNVNAQVLLSITMGSGGQAESQAAVAEVVLLPGSPNQITAEALFSQSTATCAGVSGFSDIASLTVAGQHITVSESPNQVVSVPGVLTLVINEQVVGPGNSITVNALDLTTVGGIRVIVSSAHSDITCPPPPPPPSACLKDFVTAGGWIAPSGTKDTFGFHAGYHQDCKLSGHVEYIDHSKGIRVSTSSVTSYGGTGNTRTFSGLATVNGQTVTYTIKATDNGPGPGNSYFSISLSNGYSASGTLGGGNIEIHT